MCDKRLEQNKGLPEIRKEICPICSSTLKCGSRPYSLRELLELWEPVQFSENVARELSKQANSTQLFTCPECDLEIFLPSIIGPPEFYSQLSKHETLHYYEEEKWEFGEALKDLTRGASVIEMGCGSGSFLRKIRPFVSEVCGIESNDHAVAAARSAGLNVLAKGGDITQLKMRFDYAFCFHVLEHVADPVEFLKDLSLLVKPGGRIGISVPNQDGPVKYINPCIQNMPPHHATRWHAKTFRFLARKLCLNIEKIAREPVTLGSHYYYSTHWVNHKFPNQTLRSIFFRSMLQRASSSSFEAIFKFLSVLNIRSLRLLKGQGMYVLLSNSKGKCV